MMSAEFFDIFGMIAFLFIIVLSLWSLSKRKKIPNWALLILLIVGIVGFLVDLIIVYTYFF